MNTDGPNAADAATTVAQTSSLLYRGFPTRRAHAGTAGTRTASRLEVGDTAGWKPALRRRSRAQGKIFAVFSRSCVIVLRILFAAKERMERKKNFSHSASVNGG
jgi:hypothetical protein